MPSYYILPALLLMVAVIASIFSHKLTPAAGVTGGFVGWFIFLGAGYWGLAMIGAFFLLGSIATSWKWEVKAAARLEEHNRGRRNTGQVLANGGVPALLGILSCVMPGKEQVFPFLIASGISAATADTLSSELGMVYGQHFYHILTFRKSLRGENGLISREGTLFGIAGSLTVALIYSLGFGWGWPLFFIVLAGTAGNFADSLLGAWLENRGYIGNNTVNFLCTLSGSLIGLLFFLLKN